MEYLFPWNLTSLPHKNLVVLFSSPENRKELFSCLILRCVQILMSKCFPCRVVTVAYQINIPFTVSAYHMYTGSLAHVPTAPFPILLTAYALEKQRTMVQVIGAMHLCGKTSSDSHLWLL